MNKIEFENGEYDFEEWEGDVIFIEEKDWPGLLKLRKERAEKRSSDLHAQQGYAAALVLNKEYSKAIEFLKPLYQKHYDIEFGVTEIIDALYGLGKTENDFNWITPLTILKLDQNTTDLCIEFLKNRRKHVSIVDIYTKLIMQADYYTFNEKELAEFLLKQSMIFDFIGDKQHFWDLELKLKKRK